MYNQFVPKEGFRPVSPPESAPGQENPSGARSNAPFSFLSSLFGGGQGAKKGAGLSGLLDRFGLGKLDHGDWLLILILIYLFRESEDEEWLIILALVVLMGL